jgi:DTW domain-containing protein YfiP
MDQTADAAAAEHEAICPHCLKPMSLSVCDAITPIKNRVAVLILQHPQEQDKILGTARLTAVSLGDVTFRIGLSWPSLAKALGRPADPRRWAVLHLGALRPADFPKDRDVLVLDRKGAPAEDQDDALADIDGIVVFDGTWSQAKTLWWRNPWVLKAKRVALNPRRPSLYGALRREPRREGLATIEAVGMLLSRIEGRPEIEATLRGNFQMMLDRIAAAGVAIPRPGRPGGGGRGQGRGQRRRQRQTPGR